MAILDKIGSAIETQKLNSKISSEKDAINGIYAKIGEYYYKSYKSGTTLPEEATAHCVAIDGHNKVIDETKAEIERLTAAEKGGTVCPSCGKANAPGTKFCRECGTKLPEEAPAAPKEGACPSCGKVNPPGTKFCCECGAKLADAAPAAPKEGVCPSCGHANPPGTKFCRECGAKLN